MSQQLDNNTINTAAGYLIAIPEVAGGAIAPVRAGD
jgi:hypothetical protein